MLFKFLLKKTGSWLVWEEIGCFRNQIETWSDCEQTASWCDGGCSNSPLSWCMDILLLVQIENIVILFILSMCVNANNSNHHAIKNKLFFFLLLECHI